MRSSLSLSLFIPFVANYLLPGSHNTGRFTQKKKELVKTSEQKMFQLFQVIKNYAHRYLKLKICIRLHLGRYRYQTGLWTQKWPRLLFHYVNNHYVFHIRAFIGSINQVLVLGRRVAQAMVEHLRSRDCKSPAVCTALVLVKVIGKKMWENSKNLLMQVWFIKSPFYSRLVLTLQLDGVGKISAKKLEEAGIIDFNAAMELENSRIEFLSHRRSPFGYQKLLFEIQCFHNLVILIPFLFKFPFVDGN